MSSSPVKASPTVVEGPGFDFVEDDDVLFTLTLCREIHRLYGSYHDGTLAADDRAWAGLSLTLEMLAALRTRVTEGMPALRLKVALSQAEEMNTVLFGRRLPASQALDAARSAHYPALEAPAPAPPPSLVARWLGFWSRSPAAVRLVVGFLACCLVGVLIDVPFVVMALFPEELVPLLVVFVVVPLAGWAWLRARSAGRPALSRA